MDVDYIVTGFQFVEAPRFSDDGTLFFSDLTGGGLYAVGQHGAVKTVVADRRWIGGAVIDIGGIICGGEGGLVFVDPATGACRALLDNIAGTPIAAVNDIEADAAGGIYGGTIDFAAIFERDQVPTDGVLFRLDPSGRLDILRDDVTVSNGLAFSPDRRCLYHSESTVGLWVWSINGDELPHSPRLLVEIDDCDGIAVNAAGDIWVACWKSAELRRYSPDGTLADCLRLPVPHLISPTFGGPNNADLYVAVGGNAESPNQGGIIRIAVDVPGLATSRSRFRDRWLVETSEIQSPYSSINVR